MDDPSGTEVDADCLRHALRGTTLELEAAKDRLTELDAAVGDGDLGITMTRGSQAIREGLGTEPDLGRILIKAGMDFGNSAPSTMGALLGTALMRAGKAVQGQTNATSQDVLRMVTAAEEGIRERGKAQPGDKTMLDALVPAREALEHALARGSNLSEAVQSAAAAARRGMLATINMEASMGRARWLGGRTIGHQDPGATVVAFIFASLARHTKQT